MVILPVFWPRVSHAFLRYLDIRLTLDFGNRPYFGQAAWFLNYHPEKLPSAIERYQKEILRVFGVLESVLAKQEWLVGGKYTIADLSFVT